MQPRIRWLVLMVLAALLVSCGGEQQVVPAFVPPATTAPVPTAVPTPLPLDQVDLAAVFKAATTIPKGLTAGEITKGTPEAYTQLTRPATINAATQSFLHGKDPAGYAVIALYPDEIKLNDAYTVTKFEITESAKLTGDKVDEIADLGKQALAHTATSLLPGTSLGFIRCRAVVYIFMTGDLVDTKSVTAYARELDSQLTPAICQ